MVLLWVVNVAEWFGVMTGDTENEWIVLSECLGVEWIWSLVGIGDVKSSEAVASLGRFCVGREMSRLSLLTVLTLSNDGDVVLGVCNSDDGELKSRELNLLQLWMGEVEKDEL